MPHRLLPLFAVFIVTLCAVRSTQAETDEQVLFSFDDVSIPWRDNVKLTLVRPQKHSGNPVLKPGGPESVDEMATLLYGTVLKEGDKFRMWYIAWPRWKTREPAEMYWRPVAYAESVDGVNWTKPNLGLVEYRGDKRNNIVLVERNGEGQTAEALARPYDFVSVLRDEADPDAARRYKMAYIVYDEKAGWGTTATAVSADGLRWQVANSEPFTKGHFENTSLIRFRGLYYMTGQNIGRGGGTLLDGTDRGRLMTGFFSPRLQALVQRPRPQFLPQPRRRRSRILRSRDAHGRRSLEPRQRCRRPLRPLVRRYDAAAAREGCEFQGRLARRIAQDRSRPLLQQRRDSLSRAGGELRLRAAR